MKKSIETLWLQFVNKLKTFVLSKVHDETIADDILQDVFIKIHNKIDQLNDDTKIQSWIYQLTRNLIVDYFRDLKKENHKSQYLFEDIEEDTSDNLMSEAMKDMLKMMDDLPLPYCEALCLTELDGMSQKAYAEKIGITYSAAKSRVQRARKMLKDMLMNCCHYQFDKYGTVLEIYPANCCYCVGEHLHPQ
jgi:RNA polymerase sigma-70 factor, ECF subfamily